MLLNTVACQFCSRTMPVLHPNLRRLCTEQLTL